MSTKKEYNRKTKRWEEPEIEKVISLKKPKTCRGGRPHNFELYVPDYYRKREMTPEEIKQYYEYMDIRREFDEAEATSLKSIGIYMSRCSSNARQYKCSVCGKQKIDY